ncbi:MAG: response regulator [Hahellaceae bacterium]|nr:response regulator [Hahellaceae bacterium]
MTERILTIDDDARNVKLIECYLEDESYDIVVAHDGEEGWNILQKEHQTIDLILLDRMMPVLDGIEFLKRYRAATNLKRIPVIMQTAASEPGQIREGLELGVFYYLTKPYDDEVLISLVKAAIEDSRRSRDLYAAMEERDRTFALVSEMRLEFRTIAQARAVAATLAHFFPDPDRVVNGISELLINAVEHGNLGIQYAEKTALLHAGRWLAEVELRQVSPDYSHKQVQVHMKRNREHMTLQIDDEGNGFDWKKYMEFNAERASDPHGRGIAMANMLSFDKLTYQGKGNSVICTVNLPAND